MRYINIYVSHMYMMLKKILEILFLKSFLCLKFNSLLSNLCPVIPTFML